MNVGIFTDTYFPQVSGVATSIKTLKNELEKDGHRVYIFTTTDPHVSKNTLEPNIFRFASIPFISFSDRRIAVRGFMQALQVAKDLDLDIVHTQTEFSLGWMGKFVAKQLEIPCIHTYHTMYEDYLHYILNGHLLKPFHVKQMTRAFCYHLSGVVAPSQRVVDTLTNYGIKIPIRIIPTGVDISKFEKKAETNAVLNDYPFNIEKPILLSLSRLAFEKNIQEVIATMPAILERQPEVQLVIAGDGPARETLEEQANELGLNHRVFFVGEVDNDEVARYYQLADLFVSASDSESQGLTYIEAMASGVKCVVSENPYTDYLLNDPSLGITFTTEQGMVEAIDRYLSHPYVFNDPNPRKKKLYEISSDCFAENVILFYKSAIDSFTREEQEEVTDVR